MNALLALSGLRKIIKYISSEHAFLQITVYPSMPAFFFGLAEDALGSMLTIVPRTMWWRYSLNLLDV
jgi:hypothetical protein